MNDTQIKAAIVGATGYAGEGTLKLLLGHPNVQIVHVGSDRLAGQSIGDAVPALARSCDLTLAPDTTDAIQTSAADVVFLCKKSPDVTALVPQLIESGVKIIDIGAEFRLRDHADYQQWHGDGHLCPEVLPQAVYGLSEWHDDAIANAQVIGNPGCYPTSILLPLLPLLQQGIINNSAAITSVSYSGLSGAGKRFHEGNNNLFYAMNENMHSYKALAHQHTAEIDQELSAAASGRTHLHFVPHLAPITRGIHSTISCQLADGKTRDDVYSAWNHSYADRTFVRSYARTQDVEVANVAMSNFCDFAADADGTTLIITSVIDNLVKGASGQAVQNMNIAYGLPEETGLLHRSC